MNFVSPQLFNAEWYLARNPDVAAAVDAGLMSAYSHFMQFGISENRAPLSLFDSDFYLARNPDVAAAVAAGTMSAVEHFLMFGQGEPRAINPFIDLGAYMSANPDVAAAAQTGMSLLGHLLQYGAAENRDLGNGVGLGMFREDPQFQAAIGSGNFLIAMERVGQVAPFLPSFLPPARWTPPADTPIPTDFVPPAGTVLVIPPSISVPPGMSLPPIFAPIAPPSPPPAAARGDNEDADPPASPPPTFTVTEVETDSGVFGFGGSASGDITFTITENRSNALDVTFTRAGLSVTIQDYGATVTDFLMLAAGQTLSGTAADVEVLANLNDGIVGDGAVTIAGYDNDETDLLSVGTAVATINITADVSVPVSPSTAESHRYIVADGVTLTIGSTALLPGTSVTGAGNVRVALNDDYEGDDLAALAVDGEATALVEGVVDISGYTRLDPITAFEVNVTGALTLTAAQAHLRKSGAMAMRSSRARTATS